MIVSGSGSGPLAPGAGQLLEEVADLVGLKAGQVDGILQEAGITLKSPAPADRRLAVLRLQMSGIKHSGEAFGFEQFFGPGVWVIAHPANSAGKTSLLECLVWPLRGAPRDLPPDVRSWLRTLSVDVMVAGRPTRIALEFTPTSRPAAACRISTADSEADLLESADGDLRLVAEATGLEDTSRVISSYLMDALRMEHTSMWQGKGGPDGEGAAQVHGWASYFGACYLNPGGDEILLGDVSAVGLPGRLLELFVDVPYSTALTQLSVAGKRETKLVRQQERRAQDDETARKTDRETWRRELAGLGTAIAELRADQQRDVTPLLDAADQAGALLRERLEQLNVLEQALADLTAARVRAQQALMDTRETWQARRVLGRLNPVCCPRCEEPLEAERRAHERESAACAVCTRTLPEIDAETAEAVLEGLQAELLSAEAAEGKARHQRDAAKAEVEQAQTGREQAHADLQGVLSVSGAHQRLRDLELRAAVLQGQLAATGLQSGGGQTGLANADGPDAVLETTHDVVRRYVDAAAKRLFPVMDKQIVELAARFGVQNLDSVRLNRAGQVNAVKAGVGTAFKRLSRGDRLRMRIATVIALLRVGAARGVATHPGLLLIDSVAAEEVTEVPARTLIAELQALSEELPGLQVVLTTAQPELAEGLLPRERILTGSGEHLF
ncbi:hypothetical protein ACFVYE_47075 [Streptomyces sp. NPDC058239]|uniref:hypothetical protein n=1 Tax=Streptomyces sp. NPDC058239 TaxID=3346395 RepID=UPI0036ED70E3